MRITGLATGLDMDEIVKNSMRPYRIKIETKGQDKEILEIKQKLYREVIKDSREFYNKYFDVTKSDSLLLSKNWAATKVTSSNENVLSVTAGSDAKVDNYTVKGESAKASTLTLTEFEVNSKSDSGKVIDRKVVVNGKEFIIPESLTNKEKANYLNKELKNAGINVSVRYTDFASNVSDSNKSGFIFESTVLGEANNFAVGGTYGNTIKGNNGTDAKPATITNAAFTIQTLKDAGGKIKIDDKEIQIDINDTLVNSDIQEVLNSKLKANGLTAEVDDDGKITFKTIKVGENIEEIKVSIGSFEGAFNDGEKGTPTTNTLNLDDIKGKKISINGNLVDLTGKNSIDEVMSQLNTVFKNQGISITASNENGNVLLTSKTAGEKYNIDVKVAGDDIKLGAGAKDAKFTITNSKGGVYTHEGVSNTVTLDGVTFKITGDIPAEGVTVNGKQNVTEIKDNLVKFINDYNSLIEKLNTLTSEKRNRNFSPLTADQKKEMSEDEIKLWNEKVEKGQLSRDIDLSRISNSLKQAMRSLVDGTGLNLEKIGIAPVADYQGTKNGTFTVDEGKLTKALEENSEEIMNMFINSAPKDDSLSEGQKYAKTGIINRLKDIIYRETVTITSALIKKAGIEGSSTAYDNEITKSIEKHERKMSDMEKDFTRREQALYTKYANLESIMNKYNSQQSYLMQQLGLG